jgi:ADP-ribosylglycohydrolase
MTAKPPSKNRMILDKLLEDGGIQIEPAPLFTSPPRQIEADLDRVEGMLLGLAIGDALGNTSEGMSPADRRRRYGEIRDFLPNNYAGGERVGLPSDDTQLSFWTLDQIMSDGRVDPENIAARFCQGQIFGIGNTVSTFIRRHADGKRPWFKAGPASAGNGALMRIAPVCIPHLQSRSSELWVDAALTAMITHNDSASISACVAFVGILWDLLGGEDPSPTWWLDRYVEIAAPLELDDPYEPVFLPRKGWHGTLSEFASEVILPARAQDQSTLEACESWGSGAYLLETVPSALYILEKHGDSFEEAVVRAVNDTLDNDTSGAIVGAVMGARHGKRAIPARWIEGLLGRTRAKDDGRVQELVSQAALPSP